MKTRKNLPDKFFVPQKSKGFFREINFLIKLRKEGKLELVEPSEEIKQSYVEKSESYLVSAKLLFENNRLEESMSLAYYSMYHVLIALLSKTGIKCENHTGSIILLKEIYNIDNADMLYAKKERIDKQYYVDFHITKDEVKDMIEKAEEFNKEMHDFLSKVSNEQIQEYRKRFNSFLSKL